MKAWYLLLLAAALSNASAILEVSVASNVSLNQASVGDTVVLTCSLASDSNVTNPLYSWVHVDREETLNETSNMLVLFEISSDQFGTYHCGIRGSDGESGNASITITQALVIGFESERYFSDEGRGRVTLIIRSSIPNPGPEDIFLAIQTENGTALAGLDYRAVSDFVVLQPMEQVKEYDVEFFDDNLVEIGVETYSVVLIFAAGIELMEGVSLGIARTTIFLRDINTVTIQLDPTSVRVSEDSNEVTIVVKKEGASEIPTAVFVDTKDSTAIAAVDYVEVHETIVFAPEVTEQSLTLTLVSDNVLEEDEVFLVELSIQEGAPVTLLETTRATSINILNDDTVTFHFQSDQVFVTEGVSDSVIVTVVKEGNHAVPLTVNVVTNSIDARAGEDYESIATQLIFDPEDDSLNVSIVIVDDDVEEVPDRFNVVLGSMRADILIGEPRQITVVIIDDDDDGDSDMTEVGFSPTSYSIEEGDTSLELTIIRTGLTTFTEQLSVQYFTTPGTARDTTDYTPVTPTIATFSENESSLRVTVQIINDNVLEVREELFFVRVELIGDTPGVSLQADTATVLISDDDSVIVRWQPRDYVVIEPVGLVGLRMTYMGQTDIDITVIFSTQAVEADGQDYLNTTEEVIFDQNRNDNFVSLIVFDDNIYEGSETLLATITPVTPGVIVEGGSAAISIEDDEDFPTIGFDGVGFVEVEEGVGVVIVTVRKSTPNAIPVSVNVQTMDDTATAPGDYSPVNMDLTFGPNDEEAVVNVTIVEDSILEFTESFQLVITTVVNGQGMIPLDRLFVSLLDSSPGITVSFEQEDFTVDENLEEGEVVLTVVVSSELERTIELTLTTVDGTAVAGRDYEATAMSFTFVPGDNELSMSVRILNDDILEGDEQFSVVLSTSESEGVILVDSVANITILDEDFITISFEPSEYIVSENNGSVTLRLVKIGENDITVSVTFNTEDRSAFGRIEQLDYIPVAERIEFQPGERERFITIIILDNNAVEGMELFYGQLSIPPGEIGVNLEADRASVFIMDEDVVLVSFSQPEYTTSEDDSSVLLTIVKTGESQVIVEVEFSVIDDTAAGNLDYIPDNQLIRFDLTQDTQEASVQIFDDGTYEGLEQFIGVLRITSNEPGILAPENTTVIKIQDNDFVTVGFDRVDYVATESENNVTLTFSKRGAAVVPVTVTIVTMETEANNSATTGEDFEPVNMDVVLFPEDTTASFLVDVVNDDTLEGIEVFLVELVGGPGVTITDGEATVQIIDEDAARVGFTETKYTVSEDDGTAMVCVEKSAQIEFSFEIVVTTFQGTATAETDYTSLQQALIFSPVDQELCLSVPLLNNEALEDTEEFQLTLELQDAAQEGRIAVAPMTTTVSIIDDDAVSIELEESSYTVNEGENVTVRVLKSGQSFIATTVGIILRPGSAFAGTDYSPLLIQSLTFDPSELMKDVVIATVTDDIVEDNEVFSVELLSRNEPGVGLGTRQSASVEITDDDFVLVGFEQDSYTVLESRDEPLSITVTKIGRNERPITIPIIKVDGTATRNRDYNDSILAENVTFRASGDDMQSLSLTIIDDSVLEYTAENLRLMLSPELDQFGIMLQFGLDTTNITILDDDFVVVGFVQAEARLDEFLGSVQLPVTFTGLTNRPFTLEVDTNDDTAVASRDYILQTEGLRFPPIFEFVMIDILDDAFFEGNEEFNVTLTVPENERGIVFDVQSLRVLIQDNDRLQLAFEEIFYSINESLGLVTVNVTKLGQNERTVSVTITLESGSAQEILDFGFPTVTILTFGSQDSVLSISIPINDDVLSEGTETFSARLTLASSDEQGGVTVLPGRDTTTIEIIDDDSVTVGFAMPSLQLVETQSSGDPIEVEVLLLDGIPDGPFAVQVMTMDRTAIASQDYEPLVEILIFRPTEVSKSINLHIIGDDIIERIEEFDIVLSPNDIVPFPSNDLNVVLDPAVLRVEILDFVDLILEFESTERLVVTESDDPFVEIALVYRGGAFDIPTSAEITIFEGSATSPEDYQAFDTVARFAPLQRRAVVRINITDDDVLEETEFFIVRLFTGFIVSEFELSVEIIDNDEVRFSFDQDFYTVEEENGTVTLQVVKIGSSDIPVTVLLTTTSATAREFQDYDPTTGAMALTFAPGEDIKSVTFLIIDDIIVEDTEEFLVLLSPDDDVMDRGVSVTEPFQAVVQIEDNDRVTVGFERDGYAFAENSTSPVLVNVVKQGENEIPITVNFFLEGGSAIPNLDFEFQPVLNVTFGMDDVIVPISLTLIDDIFLENDEIFFGVLTVPAAAEDTVMLGEEGLTTITILDTNIVVVGFELSEVHVEETSDIDVQAFVVLLEGAAEIEFSVSIETIDGTAQAPNDYIALSTNLTFEPFIRRQPFTVDIIFDNALEPSEAFSIQLRSHDDRVLIDSTRMLQQIFLEDNSDGVVGFEVIETRVTEDSKFVELVVAVRGSLLGDISTLALQYNTWDGTATAPQDYEEASGIITFVSSQLEVVIQIEINDDEMFERDEFFTVQLEFFGGNVFAFVIPDLTTVVIEDNDVIVISGGDVVISENNGTVLICFELDHSTQIPITVGVVFTSRVNSTSPAEGGIDYVNEDMSLTFDPGEVVSCAQAAVLTDSEVEEEEEFCANIVSDDPRIRSSDGECDVTITILDTSEPPPAICTIQDTLVVLPFPGLMSIQPSYNFHSTCEHILLEACNTNPSTFRISVDFLSSDLDMGRTGIALDEMRIVILEDLTIQTTNLAVPLFTSSDGSQVVYANGVTITQGDDEVVIVELSTLGVIVSRQRTNNTNTLVVNVTREGSLSQVCGLCGTLDGILLHSDRNSIAQFANRNATEIFADSWRVNPGEQFLRNERRECGFLGNDTIIGDPLFAVPLNDNWSAPVIPKTTNATLPSLCFEIHGAADEIFNLVSDRCTSVNAHYFPMNIPANGNIIGSVGIRAVNRIGECVDVAVDLRERCVPRITQGNVTQASMRYNSEGIFVSSRRDSVRVSVPNCEGVQLVMWVICENVQGQEMIKFVISRGINLRPTSHGLLGQFWNIPISLRPLNYTGSNIQLISDYFNVDRLYEITVNPPFSQARSFVGELFHRSWDQKGVRCFYAGSAQGGRLSEFETHTDTVIQGRYIDYRVGGLHETQFKYSQFSSNFC